ncbi:MAG: type II toxin-antitoxin system Phd/YefM family antitoxin [Phycisphaerales bacterium]
MIRPEDISSLTSFKRDTTAHVRRLQKSKRPAILTVNGKASLVVMDAGAYQKMLDDWDFADSVEHIKRGLASFERGEGMPAREALLTLKRRLHRSRSRAA